jgi:two-component system response regulator AtoC
MQPSAVTKNESSFEWSVLVIDDDEAWRFQAQTICTEVVSDLGGKLNFVGAETISQGTEALTTQLFHVILLDKQLGDEKNITVDGINHIQDLLGIQPMAQLLMYTTDNDPRDIVRAMQLGAVGYLVKQSEITFQEYRKQQLRIAFARARVDIDRERLSRQLPQVQNEFIAKSYAMKRLVGQLESLAQVSKPVLFGGDTGRGKGAATRKLHELSAAFLKQPDRMFFNINIATLSEDLALSELFGHEAKSFSGAGEKVKVGFFELATNSDIFLDEIGEASPALQSKLLKVIEERVFQRVGGTKILKTNARMIFATNRDLKQMVAQGLFREDLYMRISTFVIELPPLEERKEDIPDLIRIFLARLNREISGSLIAYEELPNDLITYLKRDGIPGNIRGLESDITRLVVFSPKDKKNRISFENWKQVLGISKKYVPLAKSPTGTISLEQFLNCPTDFLKPGFPGLTEAKEIFERKILNEAQTKYPSMTARAKVLKLQISNASRKFSLFGKSIEKKSLQEEASYEKSVSNAPNKRRQARPEEVGT